MLNKIASLCSIVAAAILLPATASAAWPERNITFIVPYAPGGLTDSIGRITAQHVSKALGRTVVVENRPGAGGIVGSDIVAKSKPDGYTFCVCGSGAISIAPIAQKGVNYRPLTDFEFIGMLNTNPQVVLVNPKLPIDSIPSLIDYAKKNPGKLNYGSSGIGGLMHFSVALFQSRTGTKMTHIPYAGGAPATIAVLAGEADLVFTNSTDAMPHLDSKDVRAIAVTSLERASFAPNMPTVADTVPGYDVVVWNGLFAPKGTPKEILEKLASIVGKMSEDAEVKAAMAKVGAAVDNRTTDKFYAFIKAEIDQWAGLLKEIGYK